MEDIELFKNHKGLLFSHLNIRNLFNKIDTVRETFNNLNFDVITFSETWLQEHIPDNIVEIKEYDLFRNDRKILENGQTKKGGGVCTYVKTGIPVDYHKWQEFNVSNIDIECLWLELKFQHQRNIIIVNLYRPPQGNIHNFITSLENALSKIDLENRDIFILGDFDIDFIDKKKDENIKKLCNKINQWGCVKLINEVTRYGIHKESCIDQIVTNSNVILAWGVADINLSDHQLVYVQRKKSKMPIKKTTFKGRSYRNYDVNIFKQEIVEQNWNELFASTEPEKIWDIMLSKITEVADNMCPVKEFKIKKYKDPWITPEILDLINEKDRALKKAKKTKKELDWIIARHLRNNCLSKIRKSKGEFVRDELDTHKSDSKKFWKKIHDIIPKNNKNQNKNELVDQSNNQEILENDSATFIKKNSLISDQTWQKISTKNGNMKVLLLKII